MKKIILVIYLLIGINLYGADKIKCKKLFQSSIFNFYLENSCKFNKRLSSAMRKDFGNQDCKRLFSDDDIKNLNSKVLGESYKDMKKVGKDNFCKNSITTYDEQVKIYQSKYQ